jgi:uncharacterized protein YhaN
LFRLNTDLTVPVADPVRMPLADAARALGTTPDALRQKIKRGKLQAVRDNTGRLLVWVDPDTMSSTEVSSRLVSVQPEQPNDPSSHVKSLEDHVKSLTARLEVADRQVDKLRADHQAELNRLHAAHAAELERVRDELERARTETDRARDDADRQREHVNAMFDKVKDLADRLDRVHRERQAEMARPWWRRLTGR